MAVYRITFALTVTHLLYAVLMIGVNSSKDFRSTLQNGWWGLKLLGLVVFMVLSFLIPNPFFKYWGWFSMFGSVLFVFVQLVMLIDFAHSWSESWIRKHEDSEGESKFWFWALLTVTIVLFAATVAMDIVMYIFMCHDCDRNVVFITLNLLAALLYTFGSIHPSVQQANNYRSGLLQAAVVACFTTYLVFSAIMSEPASWDCNPWSEGASNRTSTIIGAVFVIVAVIYSAFNTSRSSDSWIQPETSEESKPLVKPEAEEGAAADTSAAAAGDDEAVSYNYTLFHVAFAAGAMYVGMLLTSWKIITDDAHAEATKVDSSVVSVWLKIVSGWITICLYAWTIIAPIVLPNRDWN
jgi:hypothetical protein